MKYAKPASAYRHTPCLVRYGGSSLGKHLCQDCKHFLVRLCIVNERLELMARTSKSPCMQEPDRATYPLGDRYIHSGSGNEWCRDRERRRSEYISCWESGGVELSCWYLHHKVIWCCHQMVSRPRDRFSYYKHIGCILELGSRVGWIGFDYFVLSIAACILSWCYWFAHCNRWNLASSLKSCEDCASFIRQQSTAFRSRQTDSETQLGSSKSFACIRQMNSFWKNDGRDDDALIICGYRSSLTFRESFRISWQGWALRSSERESNETWIITTTSRKCHESVLKSVARRIISYVK